MIAAAVLFSLLAAPQPGVRITWFGQSCFLIEDASGKPVVVTDPPAQSMGYSLPAAAADVVTVSHGHGDHANTAGVRGAPVIADGRTVTGRQEMQAAGLPFVLIPGFHDAKEGAQRGRNTMIRWSQGGLKLAHLGDYGQGALSDAQAADLRGLDVLFVPAGGFFTIDASQAAALVRQLAPRLAILMHFRTARGGPKQLADLETVKQAFPDVRNQPATVTVNSRALAAGPVVWAMDVAP